MADLNQITKRIEQLEKLVEENKVNKDMLKGELENDLAYLEAAEEVKAAVQKRKQIKDEILGRGPNQEVQRGIKENSEEIATIREILSAELMELYTESKTEEIANHKIIVSAKLEPKKGRFDRRDSFGQYADQGD